MPNITNPIQRFFWDNLTNGGLDLVDVAGVDRLMAYARENIITEGHAVTTPAGTANTIDNFENNALKVLLDAGEWRSLLTDDAVFRLEQLLQVQAGASHPGRGRDAIGAVPQYEGRFSRMLASNVEAQHLAETFKREVAERSGEIFDNPNLTEDDRAKQLLYLLQDYAEVLNKNDSSAHVKERGELLKAFFENPLAKVHGSADPDDDLLSTAWETVWGTNPEVGEKSFAIDKSTQWTAYMSMNGEFVETAKKLDAYLEAMGQPAKIAAFESKSPLNWVINEEKGNTKASGTFSESSAIRSTGVDFASKLLPNERVLGKRVLDPSFDLKVDFYAWGNFVTLNKGAGEQLVATRGPGGETLKVEVEEVGDAHWKPVFKTAAGEVVPSEEVIAVIKDSAGNIKGDGQATGSYSASWWGFCDRNALMGLVTMKYGFPKPSKDVTLKVGDKEHTFTAGEIALIAGRRMTELFPTTFAGNRFDDEPDRVYLDNGGSLRGKIESEVQFYQEGTARAGDVMTLPSTARGFPRGSLLVSTANGEVDVKADDIVNLRRMPATLNGDTEVSMELANGTTVVGALKSPVSFRGGVPQPDGSLLITNTKAAPIQGELKFKTQRGEAQRVPVEQIRYMTREDQNEILAEEALSYIIRNQGAFNADSWTGSSVANGTRTIDSIQRWMATDTERPSWVPADPSALVGHRGAVKNPDNVYFFHLGNQGSTYGGAKFWIEVDENKNVINSQITDGQWDFLWGVEGKPNWNARPTFNPHVPNDLVAKLYVNSLENPEAVKDILPSNWESLIIR